MRSMFFSVAEEDSQDKIQYSKKSYENILLGTFNDDIKLNDSVKFRIIVCVIWTPNKSAFYVLNIDVVFSQKKSYNKL